MFLSLQVFLLIVSPPRHTYVFLAQGHVTLEIAGYSLSSVNLLL